MSRSGGKSRPLTPEEIEQNKKYRKFLATFSSILSLIISFIFIFIVMKDENDQKTNYKIKIPFLIISIILVILIIKYRIMKEPSF